MINSTWWLDASALDKDQQNLISNADPEKSQLITGPPGSGKTNILLLRAHQMVLANLPMVQILVFNRALVNFFQSGASRYAFSADRIDTLDHWVKEFIKNQSVVPEAGTAGDFLGNRKRRVEQALSIVSSRGIEPYLNGIFIDEGQDCLPEEIELANCLARIMVVSADPRQKIYDGTDPVSIIERYTGPAAELKFHYRNGWNICKLADGIAKASGDARDTASTCQYDEAKLPSTFKLLPSTSTADAVKIALEEIDSQLAAYPGELLGVMCPTRGVLSEVSAEFRNSRLADKCIYQSTEEFLPSFSEEKPIFISTFHTAKGLEFRASHIIGLEAINQFDAKKNLVYTAVTRTKTTLSMYHSGTPPSFLMDAMLLQDGPKPMPPIKDLFKN